MIDLMLGQDPSGGFDTPLGKALTGLALLAALVVAVRAYLHNRRR